MPHEIERKFLVRDDSWRRSATGVLLRQGYLFASAQRAIRVRIAGDRGCHGYTGSMNSVPVPLASPGWLQAPRVLDGCAGYGSTGLGALLLGR